MTQLDLKIIIWDYDGTFYRFTDQFNQTCNDAGAIAARQNIPQLSLEDATEVARQSAANYGNNVEGFFPAIDKAGLCRNAFRNSHHDCYHSIIKFLQKQRMPDLFKPCAETIALFEDMPHIRHAILTHGSIEYFVRESLEETELLRFFDQDLMLDFKDYGFQNKKDSSQGFKLVLEKAGIQPQHALFVEDSRRNMFPVINDFPEAETAWIAPPEAARDKRFTHQATSAKDLLKLHSLTQRIRPQQSLQIDPHLSV